MAEPIGRRPVVLLSRNAAYAIRTSITVALVTTRIRRIRSEVSIGPREGLAEASVANLDDILTIPKESLLNQAGELSREKMEQVAAAIRFALALP